MIIESLVTLFNQKVSHVSRLDWEELRSDYNLNEVTTEYLKRNLLIRFLRRHKVTSTEILKLSECQSAGSRSNISRIESSGFYLGIEKRLGLLEPNSVQPLD